MKRLLIALLLPFLALGQAPIQRTPFTTNATAGPIVSPAQVTVGSLKAVTNVSTAALDVTNSAKFQNVTVSRVAQFDGLGNLTNGTALPFTGTAGTMVESGIVTAFRVPKTADTTGTNYIGSALFGDASGTNMNALGTFAAHKVTTTNGAAFNYADAAASNAVVTITSGTLGPAAGGGSGSSILSATGTWISSNAPAIYMNITDTSGASTNILFEVDVGGVSKFKVDKVGIVTLASSLVSGNGFFAASSGNISWTSRDLLYSDSTTEIQLGTDASGTPATQNLAGPDSTGAGGTGGQLNIKGGLGDTTGIGGSVGIQTAPGAGSSATYTDRVRIANKAAVLTDAAASSVFTFTMAATNQFSSGQLFFTLVFTNGTDIQAHSGVCSFSVVNKDGTATTSIVEAATLEAPALSAGTLTDAWTILANGTKNLTITIQVNADTSLNVAGRCFYSAYLRTDGGGVVITEN